MAFTEKPPILSGTEQEQIIALRDYLFRMASSFAESEAVDFAPIGTIYMSVNNVSPAAVIGGSWAPVPQRAIPGVFLWKRTQ